MMSKDRHDISPNFIRRFYHAPPYHINEINAIGELYERMIAWGTPLQR
jgi:hypothetical protein